MSAAPPPSETPLLEGRYQPVRTLGEGAFGSVQLCRDVELDRDVAVKILKDDGTSGEHRQRFGREAALTARLEHPNIVRVFDHGFTPEGSPFLVYEFVRGRDLQEYSAGGRAAPLARRLAWGVQVARALGYAHERGVVHRDVKPANVLVREDGEAILCDFGLGRDEASTRTILTREGVVLGTPMYLAREVVLGRPMSPASDQFAWAATLFELFHHRNLRTRVAGGVAELLKAVAARPECELPDEVEYPALDLVLRRALDPDPARRFPSMEIFAEALEELHVEGGVIRGPTRPPSSGRSRRWAVAAGVILLVGAAAIPGRETAPAPGGLVAAGRHPVAAAPRVPGRVEEAIARFRRARGAFVPGHISAAGALRVYEGRDLAALFVDQPAASNLRTFLDAWAGLVEALHEAGLLAAVDGRRVGVEDADVVRDLAGAVDLARHVIDGLQDFLTKLGRDLLVGEGTRLELVGEVREGIREVTSEGRDVLARVALLGGPRPDLVVAMEAALRAALYLGEADDALREVHRRMMNDPPAQAARVLFQARVFLTKGNRVELASCEVRREVLGDLAARRDLPPWNRERILFHRVLEGRELMRVCLNRGSRDVLPFLEADLESVMAEIPPEARGFVVDQLRIYAAMVEERRDYPGVEGRLEGLHGKLRAYLAEPGSPASGP